MPDDLNSVKTSYHHGALRPALIAAAESVIAERGIEGFSLRETARRAGVSASAPAHHFGDARGLLTAIATEAFVDLAEALRSASAGLGRAERVRAQGLAYVAFALFNRARFDLMWRAALLDREDEAYREAARDAFVALAGALGGDGATAGPADPASAPALACWALVHGFARLAIDGAFGIEEEALARAADALLPAMLDHLSV